MSHNELVFPKFPVAEPLKEALASARFLRSKNRDGREFAEGRVRPCAET